MCHVGRRTMRLGQRIDPLVIPLFRKAVLVENVGGQRWGRLVRTTVRKDFLSREGPRFIPQDVPSSARIVSIRTVSQAPFTAATRTEMLLFPASCPKRDGERTRRFPTTLVVDYFAFVSAFIAKTRLLLHFSQSLAFLSMAFAIGRIRSLVTTQ